MPKEMTHFLVADTVIKSLPEGELKEFLKANQQLVRIGSISYDTAFYGFSKRFSDFQEATLKIHGQKTDDITFPYNNVQNYSSSDRESALTAGAITHLAADSIFHPMVFYFTGWDLHDHYCMEAAMDLFFLEKKGVPFPQSVKKSLKSEKYFLNSISLWLSRFLGLEDRRSSDALKQYRRHGNIQSLLFCPFIKGLVVMLAAIFPEKFHEIAGSFYRRKRDFSKSFYNDPLNFKYPVNGKEKTADLMTLFNQSVERACELILKWWNNPEDSSFAALFSPVTGISPEFGDDFKFQAEKPPEL